MTLVLAFLAGALSILSPCVLPLAPLALGAAAAHHRFGPFALALGLALSFTAVGLFVATIGFAIGLDGDVFRAAGGVILMLAGVVLMAPGLQARFGELVGPFANWADSRFGGAGGASLGGQLLSGMALGLVWAPCVGPTLGAASALAARGENLPVVAATMLAFGIGAGLPLAMLGLLSRGALARWRGAMMQAGKGGKIALGLFLILIGLAILTGFDKTLEARLTALMPDWLVWATTAF